MFWASPGSGGMSVTHTPQQEAGLTGFTVCHCFEPGTLGWAEHVLPSQTSRAYERFQLFAVISAAWCQWKLLYDVAGPGQR